MFVWEFPDKDKPDPKFKITYHWSIQQAEYCLWTGFKTIYGEFIDTAIHIAKPEKVATFPGKKYYRNYYSKSCCQYPCLTPIFYNHILLMNK